MLSNDVAAAVELPGEGALTDAAKVMQAAAGVEETRFNNLNTRAIALVSAGSIVTSLAGLFSKELLTDSLGEAKGFVAAGLAVVLCALVAAAGCAVLGVLLPNRRAAFGNNLLTNTPGQINTSPDLDALIFTEYSEIRRSLAARNSAKAYWLHWAYVAFAIAIVAIAVSAGRVAVLAL